MFYRLVSGFHIERWDLLKSMNRKPLGEPAPEASNLALAVVLLIVILIQTSFVSCPSHPLKTAKTP